MATTAIETIAVILAVIILLKFVLFYTSRKWLLDLGGKWYSKKNRTAISLIYIALIAIILAFVLVELTIIQIFAVFFAVSLLYDLFLLRYMDGLMKDIKKLMKGLTTLEFLVWLVLAVGSVWVIYSVFYL